MLKTAFALLCVSLHSYNYVKANSELTSIIAKWNAEEDLVLPHGEDVAVGEVGLIVPVNREEDLDDDIKTGIPVIGEEVVLGGNGLIVPTNREDDLDDDIKTGIPVVGEEVVVGGNGLIVPTNREDDLDDDIKTGIPVIGEEVVVGGNGLIVPVNREDDLDDDAKKDIPVLGGETSPLDGETITGEENGGKVVVELSDDIGDTEGEIEHDNGVNIIGSPSEVLSTSNADDKTCVEDNNCKRSAQYCEGGCCWWKVCKGVECGVTKQC